jgi:hypothetical protein
MKLPSSPETTASNSLLYRPNVTGYSCEVLISSCVLNYLISTGIAYEPQVDLSRACKNVVSSAIEDQRGKTIFRSVALLIENSLNACISSYVPNFNGLVSPQANEMVSVLIKCQILD